MRGGGLRCRPAVPTGERVPGNMRSKAAATFALQSRGRRNMPARLRVRDRPAGWSNLLSGPWCCVHWLDWMCPNCQLRILRNLHGEAARRNVRGRCLVSSAHALRRRALSKPASHRGELYSGWHLPAINRSLRWGPLSASSCRWRGMSGPRRLCHRVGVLGEPCDFCRDLRHPYLRRHVMLDRSDFGPFRRSPVGCWIGRSRVRRLRPSSRAATKRRHPLASASATRLRTRARSSSPCRQPRPPRAPALHHCIADRDAKALESSE